MTETNQAYHYQVSSHGSGRYSVQCFGPDGKTRDESLLKDVNGYRACGSERTFRRPEELAAVVFAEFAGLTIGPGDWMTIEKDFRSRV